MHGNITYARLPVSPGEIPVRTTFTTLSEIVWTRGGSSWQAWLQRILLDHLVPFEVRVLVQLGGPSSSDPGAQMDSEQRTTLLLQEMTGGLSSLVQS